MSAKQINLVDSEEFEPLAESYLLKAFPLLTDIIKEGHFTGHTNKQTGTMVFCFPNVRCYCPTESQTRLITQVFNNPDGAKFLHVGQSLVITKGS